MTMGTPAQWLGPGLPLSDSMQTVHTPTWVETDSIRALSCPGRQSAGSPVEEPAQSLFLEGLFWIQTEILTDDMICCLGFASS